MEKLKERITENGIDYILAGDYYIPDLKLPEIGCVDIAQLREPVRRESPVFPHHVDTSA